MIRDRDALEYHISFLSGKIAIGATNPRLTQRDLSLAYTPDLAVPRIQIDREQDLVFKYAPTAGLSLGNIDPSAVNP